MVKILKIKPRTYSTKWLNLNFKTRLLYANLLFLKLDKKRISIKIYFLNSGDIKGEIIYFLTRTQFKIWVEWRFDNVTGVDFHFIELHKGGDIWASWRLIAKY